LLGGVGQRFHCDGEFVFFRVDVVDAHHHQLRDCSGWMTGKGGMQFVYSRVWDVQLNGVRDGQVVPG
jgi:hypothetical protein